jgi:hypothetical protein
VVARIATLVAMGESPLPPLPGGHAERLLTTSVEDVPAEYVAALARFCADAVDVECGYVGAVSIERDDGESMRRLRFCVKLVTPVSEPHDSREAATALLARLSQSQPGLVRELGFGVMADRAVAAWDANALRVYPF